MRICARAHAECYGIILRARTHRHTHAARRAADLSQSVARCPSRCRCRWRSTFCRGCSTTRAGAVRCRKPPTPGHSPPRAPPPAPTPRARSPRRHAHTPNSRHARTPPPHPHTRLPTTQLGSAGICVRIALTLPCAAAPGVPPQPRSHSGGVPAAPHAATKKPRMARHVARAATKCATRRIAMHQPAKPIMVRGRLAQ